MFVSVIYISTSDVKGVLPSPLTEEYT